MLGGKVIGLPPVLNFGSEELKARVVPDVLAAKKFICLAISEGFFIPFFGGLSLTLSTVQHMLVVMLWGYRLQLLKAKTAKNGSSTVRSFSMKCK